MWIHGRGGREWEGGSMSARMESLWSRTATSILGRDPAHQQRSPDRRRCVEQGYCKAIQPSHFQSKRGRRWMLGAHHVVLLVRPLNVIGAR